MSRSETVGGNAERGIYNGQAGVAAPGARFHADVGQGGDRNGPRSPRPGATGHRQPAHGAPRPQSRLSGYFAFGLFSALIPGGLFIKFPFYT